MPIPLRSILPVLAALGLFFAGGAWAEEDEAETPGPGSEESNSAVPLPPPRLRPPPGLSLLPGAPGEQALRHWERSEAVVDLIQHLRQELSRRMILLDVSPSVGKARGPERLEACPGAYALQRGLTVAVREVRAELKTAQALAASLPEDTVEHQALQERLERSSRLAGDHESFAAELPDRLRGWGCRSAPAATQPLPPVAPGSYEEAPARAILVQTSAAGRVLWLDDVPEAVTEEWGLGVIVLSPGSHVLCETDPRAVSCRHGVTVQPMQELSLSLQSP